MTVLSRPEPRAPRLSRERSMRRPSRREPRDPGVNEREPNRPADPAGQRARTRSRDASAATRSRRVGEHSAKKKKKITVIISHAQRCRESRRGSLERRRRQNAARSARLRRRITSFSHVPGSQEKIEPPTRQTTMKIDLSRHYERARVNTERATKADAKPRLSGKTRSWRRGVPPERKTPSIDARGPREHDAHHS